MRKSIRIKIFFFLGELGRREQSNKKIRRGKNIQKYIKNLNLSDLLL